jgi:RNA polymerase sigma-70 factor (ECF subfamily)
MVGRIERPEERRVKVLDDDDARLARALRRGDEAAAAAVEARYGRILTGFLREALPDPGTAEEVRQQVLLEVWRRGPTYDPARSSPLTWVLLIARSRAADERRRRRPEPVDPAAVAETQGSAGDGFEARLERWRLAALLDRLPEEEAKMLRMRFYEGFSQTEIAARTGIPLGTIKRRMVTGLARLRELIVEEGS